jgi:hypothetical protein
MWSQVAKNAGKLRTADISTYLYIGLAEKRDQSIFESRVVLISCYDVIYAHTNLITE